MEHDDRSRTMVRRVCDAAGVLNKWCQERRTRALVLVLVAGYSEMDMTHIALQDTLAKQRRACEIFSVGEMSICTV